jgi:hypothetical protein
VTSRGDLAAGADSFARDWRAVRADGQIQFAPLSAPKPPQTPEWLKQLGEWVDWLFGPIGRALGGAGPAVPWVAGAIVVLLGLLILWRLREPIAAWLGRPRKAAAAEPEWQPDHGAALALLEDADRLAAEGHFDEATHLLLQRSVGQIAAARPGLLEPSTTAREIAALPALPETARSAFGVIAERVERSLFALRRLTADDWQAARAAYAQFALGGPQALAA